MVPGLAVESGVGVTADKGEYARQLADALGLSVSVLTEDPWKDPCFQDGLIELVGKKTADVLSEVRLSLEEDVDDKDDMNAEDQCASDVDSDGREETASAPQPPPSAPPPNVNSLPPIMASMAPLVGERVVDMFGANVVFTGFASGLLARVQSRSSDAASSSSAAPLARHLGAIHKVNDPGLKATCKEHKRYNCWVTGKEKTQEDLQEELIQWLALADPAGAAMSENAHWVAAQDLKRKAGMRLRQKKV